VHSANKTLLNFIAKEMTVDVNVLSPFVKDQIGSNMQSNFAITKKESRLRMNKRSWNDTRLLQRTEKELIVSWISIR
jgi:hypothetical protein